MDKVAACRAAAYALSALLYALAARALEAGLTRAGLVSIVNPTAGLATLAIVLAAYAYSIKGINDNLGKNLDACDKLSPLILDLDGDGIEADAIMKAMVGLNYPAGRMRMTGLLVWDRNNDGVINDGSELFGDNTVLANGRKAAHGFAALADLDDNGDGVIDASDTAWTELRVMRWTDDNDNGMKDDGEEYLVTLDSLDIESLNTGFANSNHVDESGNEHRQEGGYTKTVTNDDGTTETVTRKMTDVWFVTSPRHESIR